MLESTRTYPALPEIGHSESHYARLAQKAESKGDSHAHEAAKVGQYLTLALNPNLPWEGKLKYFRHALRRHCTPPAYCGDDCWVFYKGLANLIREQAGQEAMKLASAEDDCYAARLSMGQTRGHIEDDAETFFTRLLGDTDHCPDYFNHDDWDQLKLLRDQWI